MLQSNQLTGFGSGGPIIELITLSSSEDDVNLFSGKVTYATADEYIVTIESGVTIGSTSTSTPALDVGTGYKVGATIHIINNGNIDGRGGSGESAGGDALKTTLAINVTNNGNVRGGGGGGGSGGTGTHDPGKGCESGGSGGGGGTGEGSQGAATSGGGGSSPGGAGGAGGTFGNSGATGSTGSNLNGCSGAQAGSAGGSGGNYANGASNITWLTAGTRLGGTTG